MGYAARIYQKVKWHGTSAPIFSRSVSGKAGTGRPFALPPSPHLSP